MIWINEPGWAKALEAERGKEYYFRLEEFVDAEYARTTVYPPKEKIFSAFELTPLENVKAVIIGQDPYHEPGQAQGVAFYVPRGVKPPPSLVNIAKELKAEASGRDATTIKAGEVVPPDLLGWTRQGVLLMNATLTVERGRAFSHARKGWEAFTDAALKALASEREHLVFLLWGAEAQKKGAFIDRTRHLVLECAHPSPLSARRGFFNSHVFARANEYLAASDREPIAW